MQRIHFIEIEDEPWCPAAIRDAATDYLQFVIEKTNPYQAALPKLEKALEDANQTKIIDLCAGGGGAWRNLLPALREKNAAVKIHLTDKYPNLSAFEKLSEEFSGNLDFSAGEIDATEVPRKLKGFRTLFSSFHHFQPEEARGILQNAVSCGEGIAIFEFTQRKTTAILAMFLTPLIVLLVTPFIKPFRFSRLFWTYFVPLVPLLVLFDGVVSCLRTYTPGEMKVLTEGLAKNYHWESGEIPVKGSLVPITFLIGCPNIDSQQEDT